MEVERVQALATVGLDALPAQFVRPSHERPENRRAIEGVTVPVISLSLPCHALVREIHEACCKWGFFLVTEQGIPPELILQLQEAGREFFGRRQEEKEKYANDPSRGNFEGCGTKMTKNHDEKVGWVDYFFHLMNPPCKVRHDIWPQRPPSYGYRFCSMLKRVPENS